jgi:hypothetical protein
VSGIAYLDKWLTFFDDLAADDLNWLLLDEVPRFYDVKNAYKRFCGTEANEINNLLDVVSQIEEVLPKLEGTKFDAMEIEDKWANIFKNKNLRYIRKLVSVLLSISASNAFCESVFSVVGNVWDAERNSFKPETVNAIVSIKVNAEFNCSQALELFLSHSDLLKLAKSNQKYMNL